MNFNVMSPGTFSTLQVTLAEGEGIKAESGAMITMSETMDVDSKMERGLLGGLTRKLLTGETLFFQTLKPLLCLYTARTSLNPSFKKLMCFEFNFPTCSVKNVLSNESN